MTVQSDTSTNWKTLTHQRTLYLAIWTGAWVLSTALATFGPMILWNAAGFTIAAVILNLLTGLGMIIASIRHLKVQDEMMQKIQLDSMAIALGVGIVGGLSYALLDTTDLITADAEIGHLVILISITYLISVITNYRRLQ